jgi:WhiB family redox-sensing transcriptional regulator
MPGFHPWMTDSSCTQYDPDMWFPGDTDSHTARRAKEVCNTKCADNTRAACLKYANDNLEQDGIWGGMDKTERRAHRKRTAA